jgi:hypothetical protein
MASTSLLQDMGGSNTTPWRNSLLPEDVNGDGVVAPIDALQVINELNSRGSYSLKQPDDPSPPYLDVNGDNSVAPIDALLVINYLNLAPQPQSSQAAVSSVSDMNQIAAAIDACFFEESLSKRNGISRLFDPLD